MASSPHDVSFQIDSMNRHPSLPRQDRSLRWPPKDAFFESRFLCANILIMISQILSSGSSSPPESYFAQRFAAMVLSCWNVSLICTIS